MRHGYELRLDENVIKLFRELLGQAYLKNCSGVPYVMTCVDPYFKSVYDQFVAVKQSCNDSSTNHGCANNTPPRNNNANNNCYNSEHS